MHLDFDTATTAERMINTLARNVNTIILRHDLIKCQSSKHLTQTKMKGMTGVKQFDKN